ELPENNPITSADDLPPDFAMWITASDRDLWQYFKDYDHRLLTHRLLTKHFAKAEARVALYFYPEVMCFEILDTHPLGQMAPKEIVELMRDVSAWVDEVVENGLREAGLNSAETRSISRGSFIVFYKPRKLRRNPEESGTDV